MESQVEPSPDPPQRRQQPVRLAAGVLVAGLGVVLLGGGLLAIMNPSSTPPSASVASVASASPTAPWGSPSPAAEGSGPMTATPNATPPAPSPTPSGDPVLVGAGDIARCDSDADEATASLVDGIPGIVFTLGDTAYESGSEGELRDCYGPSWGRFRDRTGFVATGNHDIRTDGGAPLRADFGDAAPRHGVTWFSEDGGAWHVIVLDSNCTALEGGCGVDSAQLQWLRDDLAASTARCTLALWHHPRFSSGTHGNDTAVAPFWDALHAAGADLVLNGHDHDYERFAPLDPQGRLDRERGITEVVVGTGSSLREFGTPVANAVVRSSVAPGVLVLTLQPSGWQFRFVSTDGSFSDQGSGACH